MMEVARKLYSVVKQLSVVPPSIAVLVMVAIIFIGVVMRYVFNQPVTFVDEYSGYLLALLGVWALSYALRTRAHVSVDILVRALPQRVANSLRVITHLISLLVIILLTWGTLELAITSIQAGTRAWSPLQTPLGPIQLILPIGLLFFAIEIAIETIDKIRAFVSR